MSFENEIIFVKRPRIDLLVIIFVLTILIEYNVLKEFSAGDIFWGLLFLFPLILILTYNEQLIINKRTLEVVRKDYFYKLLFSHIKIGRIGEGEKMFVKVLRQEDDLTYYLYLNRKRKVKLFSFREIQTLNLLKEKMYEFFGLEVIYMPFEMTSKEYLELQ